MWPFLALAAPACLLTAGLAVALVMAAFGRHPMWFSVQWNLSEAAAVRDLAEVARLVEAGEDPNVARDIRAGLLSGNVIRLTPLEAAVGGNDARIIRVLVANGACMDASIWNRLRCLADNDEVSAALDYLRPAGAITHCDGITAPW
jgi:hypothetical protein